MRLGFRDILIDAAMEAYVDWREESAEVESAYRRWSIAPATDTALAFAAYVAALDREDQASLTYAQVLRRAAVPYESDRWHGSRVRDAA